MTLPILYSFRRCPYAMRARLAIANGDHKVELREILLRDKAPQFLETSPKGTVPVLVLPDGTLVEESLDIMLWASPAPAPQMVQLVQQCDAQFKPNLDRYKYPTRFEDVDRAEVLRKAVLFLDELDTRLTHQTFLFGDTRSFADIGIAPFVRQFAHVDRDWFMAQSFTNVIRWYAEFTKWNGFLDIMKKYPKWVAGDPVTVFPS